jgi:hypothetical protein
LDCGKADTPEETAQRKLGHAQSASDFSEGDFLLTHCVLDHATIWLMH